MNGKEKITAVPLSDLPEINDPEGFWVFGSKDAGNGTFLSGRFLFDRLAEYARKLQLERRISLRMESASTEMFIGEKMTIYRVEGQNISSLKINGQAVDMDRAVSIQVAPKSLVQFDIASQLTDPVAYLFIYAKAELP